MTDLTFQFRDSIQRVFVAEDGRELFVGSEVCRNLGREANFARTIKTYVKAKWWIEYPNPNGGKPILCLFEPGVYQLASNPIFKSDWADQFQDFMFETVVPKLRASRGFIMKTATSEQVSALVAEYQQKAIAAIASPAATRRTMYQFLHYINDINTKPRRFWSLFSKFRIANPSYFSNLLATVGLSDAKDLMVCVAGQHDPEELRAAELACTKKGWDPDCHMLIVYHDRHEYPSWMLSDFYQHHFTEAERGHREWLKQTSLATLTIN